MKKNKFYLVTGGAGFLGAALVKRFVQDGHRVRVLDNLSRGSASRLSGFSKKIEFIKGDIRDPKTTSRAVRGVDTVCHLAFVNGTEFFYTCPEYVLEVGVKGMTNVLDACLKHRIGEFILASSSEVYQTPAVVPTDEKVSLSIPDPMNPRYSYGAGKIISEIMAINYGRKYFKRTLIFRPHNVFGPEMGWEHVVPQFVLRMKKLSEKKGSGTIDFPIQGSGKETRSFVYIDDFIHGLALVIDKGKNMEIYNIGTRDEISIADVAVRTGQYFGKQIRLRPGKPALGGTKRRCPDIKKIVALGYKAKYSFNDGLTLTAAWYDKNSRFAPKG